MSEDIKRGGMIVDKNSNGIPDKIENYALLICSILLVIAGIAGVGTQILTETFAKFIIVIGMAGILGDEVIKKVLMR